MHNAAAAHERRWRQLSHVALFWAGYLAVLVLMPVPKGMAPPRWGQLVWGAASALALAALTRAMARWEGRTARDLGVVFERATPRRREHP